MPGILALDPSIAMFGWAAGEMGAQPDFGSQRIVGENATLDEIQDALDIFLKARVEIFRPDWIVHEQTWDGPNPRTNKILHGISWQIDLRAKDWRIGCREAETMAMTKHFVGRAKFPGKTYAQRSAAKKRAMVARCHLLGWKVTDNNQADACGILSNAEVKLFPEMRLKMVRPAGPLFMEKTT